MRSEGKTEQMLDFASIPVGSTQQTGAPATRKGTGHAGGLGSFLGVEDEGWQRLETPRIGSDGISGSASTKDWLDAGPAYGKQEISMKKEETKEEAKDQEGSSSGGVAGPTSTVRSGVWHYPATTSRGGGAAGRRGPILSNTWRTRTHTHTHTHACTRIPRTPYTS